MSVTPESGAGAAPQEKTGPLAGVKVLELGTLIAGPFAARFLGEFGAGKDATCLTALDNMLGFIDRNRQAWLGWTYWAAGAWPPRYFTSVQPVNGVDPPQMKILLRHVAQPQQDRAGLR